jgi:hypothetical protein
MASLPPPRTSSSTGSNSFVQYGLRNRSSRKDVPQQKARSILSVDVAEPSVREGSQEFVTALGRTSDAALTFRLGSEQTDSAPGLETPSTHVRSLPPLVRREFKAKVEDIRQSWDGTVIEVSGDSFVARLSDVNSVAPDEIVELLKEEVDPIDQEMIRLGAMFYWHIGYRSAQGRPKERISIISFRRLPKISKTDLIRAKSFANEYKILFSEHSWESP